MLWIPITVSAYFFLALVALVDKKLLTHRVPEPIAYAFYVGLLNIVTFVLIPFGFNMLAAPLALFALSAGIAFVVGIYFLYSTLRRSEASRAIPLIGATTPLFIIFFTTVISKTPITTHELFAIGFFILGGLLLSSRQSDGDPLFRINGNTINVKIVVPGILAAFFFACSFFLTEEVFNQTEFIPGFIWMRAGNVLAALFILLLPTARKIIFQTSKHLAPSSKKIFLANQFMGGSGNLLLNIAIFLGPVTVINAMQGVQYFFIFLLALFFTAFYPRVIRESFTPRVLFSKLAGIFLIIAGFAVLFL
ncbi:MAG: EamA family transporter [bacterium]|nr:EamA family transporter [bacterium]